MKRWREFYDMYDKIFQGCAIELSLSQELFFSRDKSFIFLLKSLSLIFSSILGLTKSKKVSSTENVYFLEANTPSNYNALMPVFYSDDRTKALLCKYKLRKTVLDNKGYFDGFYDRKIKILDIINGIKYANLYTKNFKNKGFFTCLYYYLYTAGIHNNIRNFLVNSSTKNIILTNDTLIISASLSRICNDLGINCYILQHGSPTEFYFPSSSQNYIVWGEEFKRKFETGGVSGRVFALGSPKIDEAINKLPSIDKKNLFSVQEGKKIFTYFSNSHAPELTIDTHKENIKLLSHIIESDKYFLCVKLHPSESPNIFFDVLAQYDGQYIILSGNQDVYSVIQESHVCASIYSTVLIESMMFNVLTMQFNATNSKIIESYTDNGGCIEVKNSTDLLKGLYRTDRESYIIRQKEYVSKYYSNKGNSVSKILGIINYDH